MLCSSKIKLIIHLIHRRCAIKQNLRPFACVFIENKTKYNFDIHVRAPVKLFICFLLNRACRNFMITFPVKFILLLDVSFPLVFLLAILRRCLVFRFPLKILYQPREIVKSSPSSGKNDLFLPLIRRYVCNPNGYYGDI